MVNMTQVKGSGHHYTIRLPMHVTHPLFCRWKLLQTTFLPKILSLFEKKQLNHSILVTTTPKNGGEVVITSPHSTQVTTSPHSTQVTTSPSNHSVVVTRWSPPSHHFTYLIECTGYYYTILLRDGCRMWNVKLKELLKYWSHFSKPLIWYRYVFERKSGAGCLCHGDEGERV